MNKTALLIIMLISFDLSITSQNKINYPIKSGSIAYSIQNKDIERKSTLYFEDYGNKQCSEMQVEISGKKLHTRYLINKGKSYRLDMIQKTYTEVELSEEDFLKMSYSKWDETLTSKGLFKLGTEDVFGKTCQIYINKENGYEVKFWCWKDLVLKMDITNEDITFSMVTTSIDESVPDYNYFEVPVDFVKKYD